MEIAMDVKGKRATFNMLTSPPIKGEILYAPCATGDCWQVKDSEGYIHFIQTFESMVLQDRGVENE
jgi:hypothetical protein